MQFTRNMAMKYGPKIAVVSAAVVPFLARATGEVFDASTYTPTIALTIPGILAIGGGVFLVVLALKSTKWGRRAL